VPAENEAYVHTYACMYARGTHILRACVSECVVYVSVLCGLVCVCGHGSNMQPLVGLPTAESGYPDHSRGSELATMVDGGAQLKFTVP